MCDVYLYGMISPSTVHILDDRFTFPHPNEYAEIRRTLPSIGGEAINSAIMLSKLGLSTQFDGNWLNQKIAGKVFDLLKPFKIDLTRITIKPDGGTEEIVITDNASRTVFGNYASFHEGEKQWNSPRETDIQNASLVSLDPYFKQDSLEVARMCVKNKKPYVTIDSRYDDFIAQNAASVIISHELRNQAYPDGDMERLFECYQSHCMGLVVFTFGSDSLWFARQGMKVKKVKPYQIKPIDTTGAGDSFRSGIIYGLFNSWTDEATVDFASAVAACVCLTIPHTLNAPEKDDVLKFMEENRQPTGM
jgi:sugar/nucleoside kinase (ribokinase family)